MQEKRYEVVLRKGNVLLEIMSGIGQLAHFKDVYQNR